MALRLLGEAWLGVFSGVLTLLIIIGAEIIPKTIGQRHAVPIGLLIARPLRLLTFLFTPLVWLIERVTAPITRGVVAPSTSESEIRLLAHIGHREGVIDPEEAQLVQHVFELNDRFARDLMTPRTVLTHLEGRRTLEEAKEEIIAAPHSRILITGEDTDDVLGVALKTQLLAALVRGGRGPVSELAQEVQFVPEVMRGDDLLRLFRGTRQHLAVVVDEYGGVAGVVTLEDVLEVLTGPIADETDRWVNLRAVARRKAQQRLEETRRGRGGEAPGDDA
jgi:CBS domain containing-hemolysin-like protein